ncbi:unnamed protein product, partial [Ixodes hexagonus]
FHPAAVNPLDPAKSSSEPRTPAAGNSSPAPNMIVALLLAAVSFTAACPSPAVPKSGRLIAARTALNQTRYAVGTTVNYVCNESFDLLGRASRACRSDGSWDPPGLPICATNVATGGQVFQSTSNHTGDAGLAVDGNRTTCSATLRQKSPWFVLELRNALPVSVVKLTFPPGTALPPGSSLTVRVGNSSTAFQRNSVCNMFSGILESGRDLYLPCLTGIRGSHVSLHLRGIEPLSLCEFVVYSETLGLSARLQETTTSVPSRERKSSYGVLGPKGLVSVCVGVCVLLASVCLCCCWKQCKKCCCGARFSKAPVKASGGEPNPMAFVFGERSLDRGYQNSWDALFRDGTAPTGDFGVTKKLESLPRVTGALYK